MNAWNETFVEACALLGECNMVRQDRNQTWTKRHVWRKQGSLCDPKNTIPTVKVRGGSIMAWGCFSSYHTGRIQIIEGMMEGAMCREIHEKSLLPSASTTRMRHPKHTAKGDNWFQRKKIKVLERPSQSPVLNPTYSIVMCMCFESLSDERLL